MPKSKRDRTVSLTVTKRKGLEFKQNLITEIRESLDSYENLFVISMFNQRNLFLKELRAKWSDSKFMFGKNKVISLALGRSVESEYKDSLHKVTPHLFGSIGLLFTNKSKKEVEDYFGEFSCPDFARSGNIATEDVTIEAGPLTQFQHTMEPQLRKLGLNTSLVRGTVTLSTDFHVCKKNDKLNPEQARLLKLFEHMQATFRVKVKLYWNTNGEFEVLDTSPDDQIADDDDENSNDDDQEETITVDKNNNATEKVQEDEPKPKKLKSKNKK